MIKSEKVLNCIIRLAMMCMPLFLISGAKAAVRFADNRNYLPSKEGTCSFYSKAKARAFTVLPNQANTSARTDISFKAIAAKYTRYIHEVEAQLSEVYHQYRLASEEQKQALHFKYMQIKEILKDLKVNYRLAIAEANAAKLSKQAKPKCELAAKKTLVDNLADALSKISFLN